MSTHFPADGNAPATATTVPAPNRCLVTANGRHCLRPASWLLYHSSCTTAVPYCHEHAEQLANAVLAGNVTPACGVCRRRVTPTWLPL